MAKFILIDSETTELPERRKGGEVLQPRLVSFAWASWDSASLSFDDNYDVVRPDGFAIPDDATAIHGISTEDALQTGVPIDEVFGKLRAASTFLARPPHRGAD